MMGGLGAGTRYFPIIVYWGTGLEGTGVARWVVEAGWVIETGGFEGVVAAAWKIEVGARLGGPFILKDTPT
jgi:hypothetical protein